MTKSKFERNLRPLFIIIMVTLLISSCAKEDPRVENPCEKIGTLSVTLNGEEWTSTEFNNSLSISNNFGVDGKTLTLIAIHPNGSSLSIYATDLTSGLDGDCMSSSAVYTPDEDAIIGDNSFMFIYKSSETNYQANEGTFEITSCDDVNQTISGKFSIGGSGEDEFVGIEGTFSNLCYWLRRL